MKLVQKLPAAFAVACVMMMSSCSKDDAKAPEPEVGVEKTEANMKTSLTIQNPYFAPTISLTGYDYYPKDWKRAIYPGTALFPGTPSVSALPTGVSNRTHAFGISGISHQWIMPLPAIPSAPGANSFVTITTKSSEYDVAKRADVKTKIENLEVGQSYSIDFYVATTAVSGPNAGYAKQVWAEVSDPYTPLSIELTGKKAEWVKKSIVFKAKYPLTFFTFAAKSENDTFAYAHIYVDQKSIKKVLTHQ